MKIKARHVFRMALLVALGALYITCTAHMEDRPKLPRSTELYVRDRVVQLAGPQGRCSGIQVRTPRGRDYVLTAAHCDVLAVNGAIGGAFDEGRPIPLRVIEDSRTNDLMLLEGIPGREGIVIAEGIEPLERITALTHALGLPTRLDEGEFLVDMKIDIPLEPAYTDAEKAACVALPKNRIASTFLGDLCVMSVVETISSIHIEPGSSGGPAVNVRGELVGIASTGNQSLSTWVTLKDIKEFMRSY